MESNIYLHMINMKMCQKSSLQHVTYLSTFDLDITRWTLKQKQMFQSAVQKRCTASTYSITELQGHSEENIPVISVDHISTCCFLFFGHLLSSFAVARAFNTYILIFRTDSVSTFVPVFLHFELGTNRMIRSLMRRTFTTSCLQKVLTQ